MDDAERRAARALWPVRKFRLGEEPPDDYMASISEAERKQLEERMAEFADAVKRARDAASLSETSDGRASDSLG